MAYPKQVNGGAWSGSVGSVPPGATVKVRVTSEEREIEGSDLRLPLLLSVQAGKCGLEAVGEDCRHMVSPARWTSSSIRKLD